MAITKGRNAGDAERGFCRRHLHRRKKLLDDGKFESVSDLAREIGPDVSFAARLMRLTLLAPDIVEAILMGEEPSGLSLTMLTNVRSVNWAEQRRESGFAP